MKNISTIILTFLFYASAQGQYFQKAFGVNNPNQQELYGISTDSNDNIYTSGAFKNINYFQEPIFWGTLSKLSPAGNLLWYKSYLPDDAAPFEGMFINSIVHTDDN